MAACNAVALSLGNAHGAVVLGRPIDLVFDVHTDPGMAVDSACIVADAVAGETKIEGVRLRVMPQPGEGGQVSTVRIRSSVVVDEPVLTVRLTVGCEGATSRTYHFFGELPATVAANTTAPVAIPAFVPRASASDSRRASSGDASAVAQLPRSPARNVARARKPEAEASSMAAAPRQPPLRSTPKAKAALKAVAPPQSRLVMEPLDSWLTTDPAASSLHLTTQLAAPPSEVPDERRTQAAALWKSLSAPDEKTLEYQARLQQQQADLAAAQAIAASARAASADAQQRLERMEQERFSATLVYALMGVLAVALIALAWLWMRVRAQSARAEQAWRGVVASSTNGPHAEAPDAALFEEFMAEEAMQAPSQVLSDAASEPPAPHGPVPTSIAPTPLAPMVTGSPQELALRSPVARAQERAVHVVHPEDLFDLQQQAEFFVSVGEHDQAIGVMKRHIADNEKTSPLAYLELLRLYHSLSRVGDFNTLRAQFHRYFNAHIPEFALFHRTGRNLQDYPEDLAQIEVLWSDPAVLPCLEGFLFCRDGADTGRFDLCAYDDLLLLYAIARTTPASARGAPAPRARTTPRGSAERDPKSVQPQIDVPGDVPAPAKAVLTPPVTPTSDQGNLMEYDLHWEPKVAITPAADALPAVRGAAKVSIDIDLSDLESIDDAALPPLTHSELPAMPVTPTPAPDQPVGFGVNSDRVEARFDLEERKAPI